MPPIHAGFNTFAPQYGAGPMGGVHAPHHHHHQHQHHHAMGGSHFTGQGHPGGGANQGLMFHPQHQHMGGNPYQNMQQQPGVGDSSLDKSCARTLRAFGMRWSQDAMQARSWKAASRMIDMYTQARTSDDVVRWHEGMKASGCEPTKAT